MEVRNFTAVLVTLAFCLFKVSSVNSLTYSDLVALNVTCDDKDNCERGRNSRFSVLLNYKERNCFCDHICSYYGDCCINAAKYNEADQIFDNKPQACVKLRNYGSIYMQTKCSANWKGDNSIRKLCASASPQMDAPRPDPFLSTPVTSRQSKFTYPNIYCAICNNDSSDVISWKPRVECPTVQNENEFLREQKDPSSVLAKIKYEDKSWGVMWNSTRHMCYVDPYMPETAVEMIRMCKDSISACPRGYEDEQTVKLCNSYTAVVYHRGTAYRNPHCAMCNNLTSSVMSCFNYPYTRFRTNEDFDTISFSLLLDFSDSTSNNLVGSKCLEDQVWDPFFNRCRVVFCEKEGERFKDGKCTSSEDEFTLDASTNNAMVPVTVTYEIDEDINNNSTHNSQRIIIFPGESTPRAPYTNVVNDTTDISSNKSKLNCNRILLPEDEFVFSDDSNILIPKYQKILTIEEYEIYDGGVLVCLFDSSHGKFSSIMGLITVVGLGISFVCLTLHLIAFIMVSELRNLSGKNLASLCVSLLAAYVCFILGAFGEEGKIECIILGSLMYYFFLASFCWMNVMAFDVWRTLRLATNELRVSGGQQWKKFIAYSVYGWITPGAALTALLLVDLYEPSNIPEIYLPQMGRRALCWFGQRKALLVYFAAPLTFIMIMNIFFFVMAARMIASSSQSASKFSSCQSQQSHFKLYMRLALLMGLAWITGILAGYLQEESLWYIFIIFNTLQGAFIFAAFTCKKNIIRSFCCSKALEKRLITPTSSARRNLQSRDSNNSNFSQSSDSQLTSNSLSRTSSSM